MLGGVMGLVFHTLPAIEVTNVVDFFSSSMAAKQIWPKKRLRG